MRQHYPKRLQLLHWFSTALIVLLLISAQRFNLGLSEAMQRSSLTVHASLGVLFLALLLLRVQQRRALKARIPAFVLPRWQQRLAKWVQSAMYGFMFLIPLTGVITARTHELPVMLFGLIDMGSAGAVPEGFYERARAMHGWAVQAFLLTLSLHIGAALMHSLILRDGVMRSMLPRKADETALSTEVSL